MRWGWAVRWLVLVLLTLGGTIPVVAEAAPSFKAGFYPTTIHGSSSSGEEVITTEGGPVKCDIGYHAELEKASTTLTLVPTVSNCAAFGFVSATVNPEGCKYVLHLMESGSGDKASTNFDITCETGKSIEVIASTCRIEIKAQSGLAAVTLTNDTFATPKRDITFDPEVTNLAYTVTQDGFLCPLNGTGNKTGGTFTASPPTTLTGQSLNNAETKIRVEVGEPDSPPSFLAGAYPTTIHGSSSSGEEVITTEGGPVKCDIGYHAELEKASTTLTLVPTFSNCAAFGFVSATVNPEGCKYVLHLKAGLESESSASFGISCEAGKSIKVITSSCKAEIKAQSGLGLVTITDHWATPKRDIKFDPEVSGLAYTVTQDGAFCSFSGTGDKTDGKFTASPATTLTGQSPGSPKTKIGIETGGSIGARSFLASFYPTTIHGSSSSGEEVITTEGGPVKCDIGYHAELEKASTTLTLVPTFSNCAAFGFVSATVNPEGCKYVLHLIGGDIEGEIAASFDISCEAGKSIKVIASSCKAEIQTQSGLGLVWLTSDTGATPKRDITFDPEVTNLAYTVTQDGFLCPFNSTGSKAGGTFTASPATTLTGQSPGSPEAKIGIEVGAPASSGSGFTAPNYPVTLDGSAAKGAQLINTEGGKIECAIGYHAQVNASSRTLALAPTFSNCAAFGLGSATVSPNSCSYLFHVMNGGIADEIAASASVSCEAGKAIIVSAGTCKVEIPTQSDLLAVMLISNEGASPQPDIAFDPEVTNLAYTVTQDGFLCPFNSTGSKAGGTFTAISATTLTGQSPGSPETKKAIFVR